MLRRRARTLARIESICALTSRSGLGYRSELAFAFPELPMLTAYVPSAAGLKKFDGLQPDALPGEAIWIDMKTPSPGEDKAVEKLVGIEIPTR